MNVPTYEVSTPATNLPIDSMNENLKDWKKEADKALTIDTALTIIVTAPYYADEKTIISNTRKGKKKERVIETIDIPFKVKYVLGKCTKCDNRRHKGMFKSSRGSKGYNGIVPCTCLKKALYIPTEEEIKEANEKARIEQEKLQSKPVDFVNSNSI